jgi:6-phosphogluconolactonase (cycloisomerase 2 family)
MKNIYIAFLSIFSLTTIQAQDNKLNLIVGTYAKSFESKGIYVFEFDSKTASFILKSNTENILNLSYLSFPMTINLSIRCSKTIKKSSVSAFGYNSKSGKIDLINFEFSKVQNGRYILNDDKNVITVNDISAFKILKNGKLELVQRTSTLGKGPRNFAIDPTGNYLLVGHQYSNEVVLFKRDKSTGGLTDTGKRIPLCSPVCLVFTKI